ncbi:MAG: hypothetical protein JNK75_07240 [Betaproteobacteria bacterium]|nr:hypothetical protein [Betaproteobacteria bacterium]
MSSRRRFLATPLILAPALLPGCGGGGGTSAPAVPLPDPVVPPTGVVGPAWFGFGRDAQHTSLGAAAAQPIDRILWQTPVDLARQYSGSLLFAHYGSPVITAKNSVILGVKTQAAGTFRIESRAGATGALLWSAPTDYLPPPGPAWFPTYNLVLTAAHRLYAPAAGGRLMMRVDADAAAETMQSIVFYGAATYSAAPAAYDANVFINTPLTADAAGNIYFGFQVNGANPAGLTSGIARVTPAGTGTWVAAAAAAQDALIGKCATNAAPALSADGRTLYVLVSETPRAGFIGSGRLLALEAATLATQASVRLIDPAAGTPAWVNDNGTSSPMVGPDGDVYIGVLEANPPSHHFTGWLLHFNATLAQIKTPGAFGWDNTPSVVPAAMVPSYTGASSYLLLSKYNHYARAGGDGGNRVAILDPNQVQADKILGTPVMKEILSQLGPTPDPANPGGVYEWCINVAAVDPASRSVLINSEDGYLYRWDLAANAFAQRVRLNSGVGQAYTPTVLGPDGVVYSVNNAVLMAAGR